MKRFCLLILALILAASLVSCGVAEEKNYIPQTVTDTDGTVHSEFYIPGYGSPRVTQCFDEVVLGSEFATGRGDASLVQKWRGKLTYSVDGDFTQSDLDVIAEFFGIFKDSPGFPEVKYSKNDKNADLQIHFLPHGEFIEATKDTTSSYNTDGMATYYFDADTNVIDSGVIYYNNEMVPYIRRSVLLEELYNVMGAPNDTVMRDDSIVYQFASAASDLSDMDELIMRLLYLPNIKCGMSRDEVGAVISELYY